MNWHLCVNYMSNVVLSLPHIKKMQPQSVAPLLNIVVEMQLLKDSRDACGFFHDKPSHFPMSSGGNRPLCLYEAVSGRNAGFSWGGDGKGESMITPTPFRFMVKTEGLLWMHVRGRGERRPSTLGLPKQMFNWTTLCYSLHPSLSFLCLSFLWSHIGKVGHTFRLRLFCSVFVFQTELCVRRCCKYWMLGLIINHSCPDRFLRCLAQVAFKNICR